MTAHIAAGRQTADAGERFDVLVLTPAVSMN
jgi:hypothetical protein